MSAVFDSTNAEWQRDCRLWRGRVLAGRFAHWCIDWDGLPVDETTPEWPCVCAAELRAARGGDCHDGPAEPDPEAAYRDASFAPRVCDCCGQVYRGPAVYCSLACALADAGG